MVEGEPAMQVRLLTLLRSLGYSRESVYIAGSFSEAHELVHAKVFELILIDVGLSKECGVDFIKAVRQQSADVIMLVISAWSTQACILGALNAGVSGYLLKERDDFELTLLLRSATKGGTPIDPFIAKHLLSNLQSDEKTQVVSENPLSARETEVLQLLARGLSNPEIAENLFISRNTVEAHVKKIYRKLDAGSRMNAVSAARSMGLIDLD